VHPEKAPGSRQVIDFFNGYLRQRLKLPGHQVSQYAQVGLDFGIISIHMKDKLPSVATGDKYQTVTAVDQVGASNPPGQAIFERFYRNTAQRCRVLRVQSENLPAGRQALQPLKSLVGRELRTRDVLEKIVGNDFAGQFHQAQCSE
jgi:hypothetical protein